mmetsp:Transcript_2907/g.6917  ORF Transcript_2907/g.6917 Transcript_2907/m.6917 type:complete len:596 (+) Transcript_2907:121-1908(+)
MISSSSGLTRGNAAMIVARNAGVTSPKSLSTLSSSALFIFSSHSPPWEPYYRFAIGHHPNCGIASERQWISNNYQRQNFSQISSLSRLSWTTKNYLTDDTNIRQTKKYHTSAIIRQKEQHQKNLPKEQKQQQQQQQQQQHQQEQQQRQSNRAAFLSTPVIPSILAYIEKIGVGIRPKKSIHKLRHRKGVSKKDGPHPSTSEKKNSQTLDEKEELTYFSGVEKMHKLFRQSNAKEKESKQGVRKRGSSRGKETVQSTENVKGAHWLPPPPFSSHWKDKSTVNTKDTIEGKEVIRQPVKLLGKAGSLKDPLPLESKGLSEVAVAGRSNVGKSTLLNALLYGNLDENLAPKRYQRGKTPERAKLPKGVKAATSDKPGETKELSFYQLTADIILEKKQKSDTIRDGLETKNTTEATKPIEKGKMSLLLVDLPGYGFAFAKEERTKEWNDLMQQYLLERKSLKRILLLLDARHGFKKTDFDFLSSLQDSLEINNIEGKSTKRELPPIQIVLTKCDLVPQADLARRVVVVRKQLSDFLIREPSSLPVMLVSAKPGLGFNNIWNDQPQGGVLELQREVAALVPVPRVHEHGSQNQSNNNMKK